MKRGHQRRGNYAINPAQFRQLRRYLLNSGNDDKFVLYVIMLTGIKWFLRGDEVVTLTVEKFEHLMFQLDDEHGVRTLAAWIRGKADTLDVLLNTYADPNDCDMDLVLHLLVYVKSFGIREGLLFPGWTEERLYKGMTFCLVKVLKKVDEHICVGTHTLRKAAYLFGVYAMLYQFGVHEVKGGKYC